MPAVNDLRRPALTLTIGAGHLSLGIADYVFLFSRLFCARESEKVARVWEPVNYNCLNTVFVLRFYRLAEVPFSAAMAQRPIGIVVKCAPISLLHLAGPTFSLVYTPSTNCRASTPELRDAIKEKLNQAMGRGDRFDPERVQRALFTRVGRNGDFNARR